ncbi:phosphotransferase [Maribacter flavus]|nr:phosphotransferase [Maribacter flavus]
MIRIHEEMPIETLQAFLAERQWLQPNEKIDRLSKAGEGNMNVVLKVHTDQRSFVLKQSREYVQKYQDISAPIERIAVEHAFYSALKHQDLQKHLPKILGFDKDAYLLYMEDLGDCKDMTYLYHQRNIDQRQLNTLVEVLHKIHSSKAPKDFPENMEMRQLNHQHIFVLPFMEDNGFSLDTVQQGLQGLAAPYKSNPELKSVISELGKKYLSQGDTLLHGDYYPGSWMSKNEEIFVLDPEFGFLGFPEFDLGVMAAHLIIATHDATFVESLSKTYPGKHDKPLVAQIASVEIMRRLIGLAQLPLERSIEEKESLLALAEKLILSK